MSNIIQIAAADGTQAKIAADVGFNCFSLEMPFGDGPCELFWADPDFLTGPTRPAGSGIPILFPFPGRVRGGKFHYKGQQYEIPAGDGRGNAIHGLVLDRPWEVTSQEAASVTARFHAAEHAPEVLAMWPADFEISCRYEVRPHVLHCQLKISNPGQKPLPYGLGTHPYFRVRLTKAGDAAACKVTVPAAEFWELTDLIPTGMKLQVDPPRDLAAGKPFAETNLDDVLTSLSAEADMVRTSIRDDAAGRTLWYEFPNWFRECVVYNPPHREAICIEPYSCVPGAIGDVLRGELDAEMFGIKFLQPGESREMEILLRVEEDSQ